MGVALGLPAGFTVGRGREYKTEGKSFVRRPRSSVFARGSFGSIAPGGASP